MSDMTGVDCRIGLSARLGFAQDLIPSLGCTWFVGCIRSIAPSVLGAHQMRIACAHRFVVVFSQLSTASEIASKRVVKVYRTSSTG